MTLSNEPSCMVNWNVFPAYGKQVDMMTNKNHWGFAEIYWSLSSLHAAFGGCHRGVGVLPIDAAGVLRSAPWFQAFWLRGSWSINVPAMFAALNILWQKKWSRNPWKKLNHRNYQAMCLSAYQCLLYILPSSSEKNRLPPRCAAFQG